MRRTPRVRLTLVVWRHHACSARLACRLATHLQQRTSVGTLFSPPSAAALHAFVAVLRNWEPGLVAITAAVRKAQAVFSFTQLRDGGVRLAVSEDTRDVAHAFAGDNDWAIGTPALHNGGCVRVTVHQGRCLAISVIGTADPGDVENGFSVYHDTAHGWHGEDVGGGVYLAGQLNYDNDGWPSDGWKTGDTAALMLDTATNILTLKHRRLARAFTIRLFGPAAWRSGSST